MARKTTPREKRKARIRKKLSAIGVADGTESPIESVRGVGYRFRKTA